MGCVRDLGLPVGGGQQLRPYGGVSNHDEFPRLQPAAGRRQEQCVLECRPILGVDFACGIELLGGVTPVQSIQQLLRSNSMIIVHIPHTTVANRGQIMPIGDCGDAVFASRLQP